VHGEPEFDLVGHGWIFHVEWWMCLVLPPLLLLQVAYRAVRMSLVSSRLVSSRRAPSALI